MIHPTAITWSVEFNSRALNRNLEGLSHEDSLAQPPHGNCINWLLGHVLVYRNMMLDLLGAERVWETEAAERYARGSDPIRGEADRPERFETLREDFDRSTERLLAALASADAGAMETPVANSTVGQRLNFLTLHEAYHVGQIGLMRRIAGRVGAIA
ncbi:MAG TPA: DinB family protein [Longimicrobiaceae bacterium]|nr:DinB family protein [Longimicrobiaceae bacterium]